jgi:hypothetical protein
VDGGNEFSEINMINNYYKPGPATPNAPVRYRIVQPSQSWSKANPVSRWGKVYVSGNYVVGNPKVTADNWDGGVQFELSPDQDATGAIASGAITNGEKLKEIEAKVRVDKPFPMPPMTIQSAQDAYESVLAHAGATLPNRDPVDQRIVKEVQTGETWGMGEQIPIDPMKGLAKNNIGVAGNGIITNVNQVGGYPEYKGEPINYPQHDGIPDWWKKKYGLDLNDPDLASKDCNGDGYTNIEKYLDGIDPSKKVDWKELKNNKDTLSNPDVLHQ